MSSKNLVGSESGVDDTPGRQSIQVIERAAAILRTLQKGSGGLTLGEIAKAVGLPRSTVQRIVDALSKESMVIAASPAHGVRLGPALISLGAATHFPIVDLARPSLESLAKATGETVDLSVMNRYNMVFVDQVSGTHRLTAVSAVGVAFPIHCSANGKAVLALMTDDELKKTYKHLNLSRHTEKTITSLKGLDKELEKIRKTGFAYDKEENSIGICAIARAFRSPSDELVAVSIPVPTQRFMSNESTLARALEIEFDALLKKFK
ncbi:MAG: IclR family transcriptional regulator [Betaproteobacteria bacterium]